MHGLGETFVHRLCSKLLAVVHQAWPATLPRTTSSGGKWSGYPYDRLRRGDNLHGYTKALEQLGNARVESAVPVPRPVGLAYNSSVVPRVSAVI